MIGYLREIRQRRRMLVARSIAERAQLAAAARPLLGALALADRIAGYARAAAAALTAFALIRRVARWASASR